MQAILKEYENIRVKNRDILNKRRAQVEAKAPAYFDYHRQIISLCMKRTTAALYPDTAGDSLSDYQSDLASLRVSKEQALIQAGFPADYLEPIYDCPDCQDTGFMANAQCKCLKRRMVRALYAQSGIEHLLETNNFSTLSYDYYEGADLEAFRGAVQICHDMIDNFTTHKDNLL